MKLTPRQFKAVHTTADCALVIAGAGSGKTRVLTERVAHLIEERGAGTSSIMCLTFTRKAAGELRQRVGERLGAKVGDALAGMLLGTFHSVAFRILRNDGHHLGYRCESLSILDPHDADMLLKQIAREMGYLSQSWVENKRTRKKELKDVWVSPIESWKRLSAYREGVYRGRQNVLGGDIAEEPFAGLLDTYRNRCHGYNVLDFGQILLQTTKLLTEFPDVLARWQQQIKHVLVDELQDSDQTQYILHRFFAPPATFFGVGDVRQSIYGFRGARPDLMIAVNPNAKVYNLVDCFRCGKAIVKAANALIAVNNEPLAEPLRCATGTKGAVNVFHGRSFDVAAKIIEAQRSGFALSDIAVMARNHRTLRRLKDICDKKNIPAHHVGSTFELCDSEAFRMVYAALRLCVNEFDDLAFLRLAPVFGLDKESLARLRSDASKNVWSLLRAHGSVEQRFDLAEAIYRQCSSKDPATLWNAQRVIGNFMEGMPDREGAQAANRWWYDHYVLTEDTPLSDVLRDFGLRDSQDDLPTGDCVTLLTVHAAKGLEWPCVIVTGLNEKNFPSSQSLKVTGGVEEERRLAYVAFTRAKERLELHYRRDEDQSARYTALPPSRFLQEAGVA